MEEIKEMESARSEYLSNFRRENDVKAHGFPAEVEEYGQKILDELKKGDLTYSDAYASLQWAYNKMRYEPNFIRLG